jgi:flagellar P-ring protein precursor FlgI
LTIDRRIVGQIVENAMSYATLPCQQAPKPKAQRFRILKGWATFLIGLSVILAPMGANAQSRIKDLAKFEGVRDNQLIGYGLVTGLNKTGDTVRNSPFTGQALTAMLERLGTNIRGSNLNPANVAAVMVTANLPPFSTQGSRIDVSVSALGDATDLNGGTLVVTSLLGADGEVYAVAQGPLSVGGFTAQGAAASVTKNVPTTARIPNGAIIEREIPFSFDGQSSIRISLFNPDLTTARRVANAINGFMGANVANAIDPTNIRVELPPSYKGNIVSMMTDVEQLRVDPDLPAKVVIDETSGIIVLGRDVRVSTVAIAQGNLTIKITETPQVSQPGAFAPQGATTQVVPRTNVSVDEDKNRKLAVVPSGVSLQDLVDGLNALGIGPRDMIQILQGIKAAGALQAEIEVR